MPAQAELTDLASVVVCARNRASLIGRTLESVALNHPGELLVIDDGSTDHTAAVAREFTTDVITSAARSLAAARQLGAERASRRYVVYVDSDVVLAPGALAQMIAPLERDPSLAAVTATLVLQPTTNYWARAARQMKDLGRQREPGETKSCSTSAVAIRRELILEFRFDPFFTGAFDDTDFFERLTNAGWRLCRCPAVAFHREQEGMWATFRRGIWHGRGAARLTAKRARIPKDAAASHAPSDRPNVPLLLLLRQRQIALLPYCLVSGAAFHSALWLQRAALLIGPRRPGYQRADAY